MHLVDEKECMDGLDESLHKNLKISWNIYFTMLKMEALLSLALFLFYVSETGVF